jgi:hypothetical protein
MSDKARTMREEARCPKGRPIERDVGRPEGRATAEERSTVSTDSSATIVGIETVTAIGRCVAPEPAQPYWRSEDGTRLSFGDLVEGLSEACAEEAVAGYAEAICELARAAARARLHGDAQEARRLAIAASRLCQEIAGFWPRDAGTPIP